MTQTLFITATGTGVGKTYVTAALCRALATAGRTVGVLKPVISGFAPDALGDSDTGVLLAALGLEASAENIDAMSPWRFGEPLSPDMAAAREGRNINFEELVAFCQTAAKGTDDYLLIEGIGGAMVPLDQTHTVLDWIAALAAPAIVVGGSYLGALSHALTTLTALRTRRLKVPAMVVSESQDATVPLAETVATLARFTYGTPVIALPRGAPAPDAVAPDAIAAIVDHVA